MSYEKVKTIKIKDNKVFINSACNNVLPLSYSEEEYPYFTKILQENGLNAVEIALLKSYEEGTLKQGTNKYTKALKVLFYIFKEEYKKFNWNNNYKYDSEEYKEVDKLRGSQEFKDLLIKCLNYKIPKERYIIFKDNNGEKVFGKKCLTHTKWSRFKEKATKYDFEEEARDNIYNSFKGIWGVEVL